LTRTSFTPFESYVVKGAHHPGGGNLQPRGPARIHTVIDGVFL